MKTFEYAWRKVRAKLSNVRLPAAQDWEDLRSEAMIRIFQNASAFDAAKSVLYTWMVTVAYRATLNGLRWWMPPEQGRWKRRVRMAKRLVTWELDGYDEDGRPVCVPVYDAVMTGAPNDPRADLDLDTFVASLHERDQKAFHLIQRGLPTKQIASRLEMRPTSMYAVVRRIGRQYRAWSEKCGMTKSR